MVSSALLITSTLDASDEAVQEKSVYGGTLTIGTSNPPTTFDPILTQHSVSATIMGLIFDSLVRIDSKGKIVPGIAESWELSKDGLVYTFHLRDDVYFHDGKKLTAEDILFTYQLYSDPKLDSPYRSHYELVQEFEALDPTTFRVILKEPFPPLIYKLVREIVPKHKLEGKDRYSTTFNDQPIGSGPFRFHEWNKKDNTIELVANDNYFEGRPYLDHILIKIYPDNQQLWVAFMRQEVDLV